MAGVAKSEGPAGTVGAAQWKSPGEGGTLALGAKLWNQQLLAHNVSRKKELNRNKERKV